jgi:hypothetical protein
MERTGARLGRPWLPWPLRSFLRPFVRRVEPYPPKGATELPAPVQTTYQAGIRQTKDHERDYYEQGCELRERIAADELVLKRTAGQILPLPAQHLSTAIYLPLLLCFGVAEACVNMVIFLVLAMSETQTVLASLMLAVSLPLLAHVAGTSWREIAYDSHKRLDCAIASGAALLMISAIAVVRCAYVTVTMQSQLGVRLSPLAIAVVFWALNTAVFAAAALAAHAHAVADPQGEALARETMAAQERRARNLEKLKSLPHIFRTLCEQADCDFKAIAPYFFVGNMEARRLVDPEPPVWLAHLPDVPLPEVLRTPKDDEPPAALVFVWRAPRRPNFGGPVSTWTVPTKEEVAR